MQVAVVGGGVAGSAAALLLARGGNDVVLIDPSVAPPLSGSSADAVFADWERPEIGQFRQPHNFLGRARRVLLDDLPDVYAELRAAGATEVGMAWLLGDAPREAGDEDLATLACRRPVFDAVLREAVSREARVEARQADVTGLVVSDDHVSGVTLSTGETLSADLVVDAAGRGPHTARWLESAGLKPWREETSDCGLLYYSRHYRVRDGQSMPPWGSPLGGPRGDVGYLAYACFLGDSDTFSVCVMAPTDERAWRGLRDPEAFERVVSSLPGLQPWLDCASPVTPVLPMGALRNTLRHPAENGLTGLVAIGDARCHTNPTFAFGASLSLAQAASLTSAAATSTDHTDLARRLEDSVGAEARARYAAVSAEDADRRSVWSGGADATDPDAVPQMFLRSVVYRVAPSDPELLRAVGRRVHGLDPIDALPRRTDLIERAVTLYEAAREGFPAPPPRDQVLAALSG